MLKNVKACLLRNTMNGLFIPFNSSFMLIERHITKKFECNKLKF